MTIRTAKLMALFEQYDGNHVVGFFNKHEGYFTLWIWNPNNTPTTITSFMLEHEDEGVYLDTAPQVPMTLNALTYRSFKIVMSKDGIPLITNALLLTLEDGSQKSIPFRAERCGFLSMLMPSHLREEISWHTQAILSHRGKEERSTNSPLALEKLEGLFLIPQKHQVTVRAFLDRWRGETMALCQSHLALLAEGASTGASRIPLMMTHEDSSPSSRLFEGLDHRIFVYGEPSWEQGSFDGTAQTFHFLNGDIRGRDLHLTSPLTEPLEAGTQLLPLMTVICDGVLYDDNHTPNHHRLRMKFERLVEQKQLSVFPNIHGYPLFPFEDELSVIASSIEPGLIVTAFTPHSKHVARERASRRFFRCTMMVRRTGHTMPLLGNVRAFFHHIMANVRPFWMPLVSLPTITLEHTAPGVMIVPKGSIKGFLPSHHCKTLLSVGDGTTQNYALLKGSQETADNVALFYDAQTTLDTHNGVLRVMTLSALEGDRLSLKHGQVYTEISFQLREVLS